MKKRIGRVVIIIAGVLAVAVTAGPFLVPVPDLDTVPVQQLAYPDSQFITLEIEGNDVDVHYRIYGQGEPVMVLIHGFAASDFSWREVTTPLSEYGTVITFDWMPYGLTERIPPVQYRGSPSPYSREAQADLLAALLTALDINTPVILMGNSAGASIAATYTLKHPGSAAALVFVDPAVSPPQQDDSTSGRRGGRGFFGLLSTPVARAIGRTPQMRRIGPLLVRDIADWGMDFGRQAWHDPSLMTDEVWEGYLRPLKADNWDVGLYEAVIAPPSSIDLSGRLDELTMPILVVTGDDDKIVPAENAIALAGALPDASLEVFTACGHAPQEECPAQFLAVVIPFLEEFTAGE